MIHVFNKKKRIFLTTTAILIVVAVLFGIQFFRGSQPAEAEWFDDDWYHRKTVTIGNTGSAAQSQKVKLDIDTASLISAGKMSIDCADARFTDSNGIVLKHFLDSSGGACNTSSTDFYVLLDQIQGSGDTIIYFYYGNASATDAGQGSQFSQSTFSPTSGPTQGSEEAGKGPVGYWKFDEGYGATVYNAASATSTDGTISGAFWQTEDECLSGTCLQFDGSDDVVTVTESPSINLTGKSGLTLSTWIKPFSDGEGNVGEILDKGSATFMRVDSETNNQLDVQVSLDLAASDATLNISKGVAVNTWSHVVMVYTDDGDDEVTVYINGVARGTSSNGSGSLVSESNNLFIGGDTAANFHGLIDEVKMYPYARSADEIKAEFNARGAHDKGASVVLGAEDSSSTLTSGLVAHWRLDEGLWNGTSNEVVDSSGNGYHGTASGNATTVVGKKNRAGTFDGTGDYVDMGDVLSFERTDTRSYSFWFKTSNTSISLFGKMDADAGTSRGYDVYIDGSGRLKAHLINTWSSNALSEYTTSAFNDGNWHHGVVTYDGSSGSAGLKIYVDGIEQGTTADTDALSATITNSVAFRIASRVSGATFNGSLDDLRIYDREISSSEVRQLFISSPLLHLKMDERVSGDAQTLYDNSGNENNTSSVDGSNNTGMDCTKRGKYGYSCEFDGTDDYVCSDENSDGTCDDDSSLDNLEQLTIMAWINPDDLNGNYIVAGKVYYTSSTINGGFVLRVGNCCSRTAELEFDIGNNDWDYAYAQNIITAGEWQHIAGVWDGSSMKIYHNGVYISTATTNATVSSIQNVSQVFGVGFIPSNGLTSDYFNGMVDEVRVYDYALTNKELIEAMNAGHPFGGSLNPSQRGYWKFDTGYGSTAFDQGVAGNSGTLTPGASGGNTTAGQMWDKGGHTLSGIDFDGTDDYVEISDTYDPVAYTISAWVKPTDITSTSILVRTSSSGPTTDWSHQLRINSSSKFEHYTNDGTGETLSGDTVISADEWYYVVGVAENSETMRLYVNGKEEGTARSLGTPLWTGGDRYRIGSDSGNGMGYFDGIIDEVKLYAVVLSADEIQREYAQDSRSVEFGSVSTDTDGVTASNAASREYCVPGDTSTCNAPVGEWKFEGRVSGDSKTVYDTSGSGNDGTTVDGSNNTGMDCTVRGKVGGACDFDGTDDHIDIGDLDANNITISAWVKPDKVALDQRIVSKWGVSNAQYLLSTDEVSSNEFTFAVVVGGANEVCDSNSTIGTYNANEWVHVVGTYDGSSCKVYVNGRDATDVQLNQADGNIDNTATTLRIGIEGTDGTSNPFDGIIDHVRIYDYARTPAQVAWEYNRGAPVGWWKFDECEGTTARDWAKDSNGGFQGNNGTITIGGSGGTTTAGTCTSGNSAHAWNNGATGKRNYSLDFDGTDDWVDLGQSTIGNMINGVSAVSVAAWINYDAVGSNQYDNIIVRGGIGNSSGANVYINVRGDSGNIGKILVGGRSQSADSFQETSSSTVVPANEWHHVTGILDFTNDQISIYIDGILDTTASVTFGASTYTHSGSPTINARISSNNYTLNRAFNGQIDDARIYGYALSGAQIKTIVGDGAVNFGPSTGAP